jgi:peptide/nickel transport system substrate-binding protein
MKKKKRLMILVAAMLVTSAMLFSGGQQEPVEEVGPEEMAAPMGKYNEAPMLAALVATGELPPVDDRIPEEVLVVEPIEKIGKYGGTIQVFATDPNPWNDMQWGAGLSDGLFRMKKDASGPEANLATGYDMSDDFKTFTYYLRKGVRWSDGAPLTADDSIFWFEDFLKNPQIKSWSQLPARDLDRAVKLDDYTVVLNLKQPHPDLLAIMAQFPSWLMFQPKHYLQKWHPKYNTEAEKLVTDEGYETWEEMLNWHADWAPQRDMELPKINSFVLREVSTAHKLYERNPYYWKVDTAGNQLPYIDRIQVQIVDGEVYQLKVISGEADYAFIGVSFENYTLYKENEATGDYKTVFLPGPYGSELSVALDLNYPDRGIRRIFQDKRFRQALSIAINREEVNNVVYFGRGVPRQATILPSASYFQDKWAKAWAQYDPARANQMLDEMGLTQKDGDGFRLTFEGKPLQIIINIPATGGASTMTNILELIKEYWGNVGVNVLIKPIDATLWREQSGLNVHMARAGHTPRVSEIINYTQGSRDFSGQGDHLVWGPVWNRWALARENIDRLTGEIKNETDAESLAELKEQLETNEANFAAAEEDLDGDTVPEGYLQVRDWFRERNLTVIGSPRYMELSEKIYDFHAEEVYMIGTVGMVPLPLIYKNSLRNRIDGSFINRSVLPYGTTDYYEQLYFE